MTRQNPDFSRGRPAGSLLVDWWQALQEDPGGRAELRRCTTTTEAVFVPAFHRLNRALHKEHRLDTDRLATSVIVLSHVRKDVPGESLGGMMGAPQSKGGASRVSDMRFRRLLRISERNTLIEQMVRMVALLDNAVPVDDLARKCYWWNETARKQLAFDYYEAAPRPKS